MARRSLLLAAALVATGTFLVLYRSLNSTLSTEEEFEIPNQELLSRQLQIAAAFQHAWDGYSKYCFGRDSLRPVDHDCADDFGGWAASAVDALSTAIIMRKENVVMEILGLVATLNFKETADHVDMKTFEIVIRHLGGMASSWDLLNLVFPDMAPDKRLRQSLYDQMVRLGDVLMCSFDPDSGIPHSHFNPTTCRPDSGSSNSVAEVGTMILEFARLSAVTGDQSYAASAERAEAYLLQTPLNEAYPGLLGTEVEVTGGKLLNAKGSWGASADSFYEYLLKAYIFDSKSYASYKSRWMLAVDTTIRSVGSHPYGHPEWTFLPEWDGDRITNRMETLSWFAGGNIILGGMVLKNDTLVRYGLSIADAAGAVYQMTATGLAGEAITWTTDCEGWGDDCNASTSLRITDRRYQLRPEVLETWYHAYRATKNPKYREWAWAAFESIMEYCKTDAGFSAIRDVTDVLHGGGPQNYQESFVYAEVLKYVYLIHLEDDQTSVHLQDSRTGMKNEWVFNTEAHPLRVKGPPV